MNLSMYQALVPVCVRTLSNLDAILAKGAAHAESHDIDPDVFLSARLYPDMFPLTRQVQIACDIAGRAAARLAGTEPASVADTESSFDELSARIRHTLEILQGFGPEQIDGNEQREIRLQLRSGEMTFSGVDYLFHFVLPNVFFHVTTAYNILRHNGVVLGKRDFLGGG